MSRRLGDLDEFRDDALSPRAREAFRASAAATEAWDRAHPMDLEAALDWIDQLRAAFGDTEVDRRPSRGNDFRLA